MQTIVFENYEHVNLKNLARRELALFTSYAANAFAINGRHVEWQLISASSLDIRRQANEAANRFVCLECGRYSLFQCAGRHHRTYGRRAQWHNFSDRQQVRELYCSDA
jgi:hypothetical protein